MIAHALPICSSRMRRRDGFTLLEVLLAAAIGAMLMGALYAALNVQMRYAQAGRDRVEHSMLVRNLLRQVASDVQLSLAPTIPLPTSSTSSSANTSTATSGGSTATGGMGASGATSTSTSSTASNTTTTTTAVQFNLGVQGQANSLTLYVSRLATDIDPLAENPVIGSDLRRIDYWLASDGMQPRGLCRQELKPVTSDDALNFMPPEMPEDPSLILAEEVRSLQFRYFDGSQWLESWDGTAPGADGMTPLGPPAAIEIRVGVLPAGVKPSDEGAQELKNYRHVVALPTANGAAQAASTTTTTTGN